MAYSIILTPRFKKEAKRLLKKYPSLKRELQELAESLTKNPRQGTNLGHNTFKIRLSVKSKGKGKSGGARVITFLVSKDYEVYLLTIYDKSEMTNIENTTLKQIIKEIKNK